MNVIVFLPTALPLDIKLGINYFDLAQYDFIVRYKIDILLMLWSFIKLSVALIQFAKCAVISHS